MLWTLGSGYGRDAGTIMYDWEGCYGRNDMGGMPLCEGCWDHHVFADLPSLQACIIITFHDMP
jgi:hypothetical protein